MQFFEFFMKATGAPPYPWQSRLATTPTWPDLLRIPTGAGKTGAILAWAWRRKYGGDAFCSQTGRRLVYVLPQRALVSQTADAARTWLSRLGLEGEIGLSVLMGGSVDHAWELEPDKPWILIGTQDQILSRALNRGYGGVSRFRWPLQFAMLHNDVQWIVDEVQLFGDGLATTAQLQAFREQLGTFGPAHTLWMSATASPEWLQTVDMRNAGRELQVWELDEADRQALSRRLMASKPIHRCPVELRGRLIKDASAYAKALADWLAAEGPLDGLALIVLNRVSRAQAVFQALCRAMPDEDIRLVHGQFRGRDRAWLAEEARTLSDRRAILVATQVVEAGMDIDAAFMVTELAPWTSLVQRFGRLNRTGARESAKAYWIDVDVADEQACLPYSPESLERARVQLVQLRDVWPAHLPRDVEPLTYGRVLRRRDLLQLFDTTPDLSGNDIDVSPFIREVEDRTVSVYWGTWEGEDPPEGLREVSEEDVCRVPLSRLQDYLKRKGRGEQTRVAYTWNPIFGRFDVVSEQRVFPGWLYLLRAEDGGYDPRLGFDPDSWTEVPHPVQVEPTSEVDAEDAEEDNGPAPSRPVTLAEHTVDVVREAQALHHLAGDDAMADALCEAAFWHDSGKRHLLFQAKLRLAMLGEEQYRAQYGGEMGHLYPPDDAELLAKSGTESGPVTHASVLMSPVVQDGEAAAQEGVATEELSAFAARKIRGFRHELASALAYLDAVPPEAVNDLRTRLVAYLVAAHHGKIRGQIRSSATEQAPVDGRPFARGVWEGDELEAYSIPGLGDWPQARLSLSVMHMGTDQRGRESWAEGVQRLLQAYGPFRLAWYEALLRVADGRASRREEVESREP
ncbi:CRISPR-associated helicase Cas3' [Alicyclobacillus mali]|uniref:CRISPR-associated helicase Cas3 n=1 Tax=Alicyclobacillus mali (ex Roth et al. 2021) TaxID=1123961 RepID=A0ABS0F536_9BACL|nr:CRISPR-associated helicase Cas3' [Alicyclobacillus mali (ex Roth et al. 2021)]MBF8378399.1 CRISPR-associated helicase Cas3' [Alicyclobacillus mali (ex Roth et al. 2021)]